MIDPLPVKPTSVPILIKKIIASSVEYTHMYFGMNCLALGL